jgi:hypothetical protein
VDKKWSPALFVALLGAGSLVAACGGTGGQAADSGATSTSTLAASKATTVPPTVTTTTVPVTTVPAGGTVPSGFDPVSFTAVSPSEYWLLGDAPCSNPVCTSIVRTTDGGSHFAGLPAPASPLLEGQGSSTGINTLRFADELDGYAFATGSGGEFWDTHDGGGQWQQPGFLTGRELLGFGTGAGYAFALVGSCQNGSCSAVTLERSPVSADQWSALTVPVPADVDQVASMTVHGSDLWFSVTTSASQANQLLVAGTGSGAQFGTYQSPCFAGLGGSIQASSAEVLWAMCPTGMMAEAFRSTDGGSQWKALSAGQLENSALLAPASDTTAVIQPAEQGELLRTNDGGATWQAVPAAGASGSWWSWVGFTDAATGSGLDQSDAPANWPWPNGPYPEQLWRTDDGGVTWSGPVTVRG